MNTCMYIHVFIYDMHGCLFFPSTGLISSVLTEVKKQKQKQKAFLQLRVITN